MFSTGVASQCIYLKLYLHRQLIYTDCTLTLPASCLIFSYFVTLFFFFECKFYYLLCKYISITRQKSSKLFGCNSHLVLWRFNFLARYISFFSAPPPPFFLFTSWRIVTQRGLFCLAQLYLWWAAVIQQRLLNRTNSPGWNMLQRPAIYRIGVGAVFQGPAAVAAH